MNNLNGYNLCMTWVVIRNVLLLKGFCLIWVAVAVFLLHLDWWSGTSLETSAGSANHRLQMLQKITERKKNKKISLDDLKLTNLKSNLFWWKQNLFLKDFFQILNTVLSQRYQQNLECRHSWWFSNFCKRKWKISISLNVAGSSF